MDGAGRSLRHFLDKGAFIYDVRWFWVIFDLPTYPDQISSYVAWPTYLPQDLTSDFEKFTVYNMDLVLLLSDHPMHLYGYQIAHIFKLVNLSIGFNGDNLKVWHKDDINCVFSVGSQNWRNLTFKAKPICASLQWYTVGRNSIMSIWAAMRQKGFGL